MRGFKNIAFKQKRIDGIFNDLKDKILLCCERMHYELSINNKTIQNDENKIRNYLVEQYLNNNGIRKEFGLIAFLFTPESPERYDEKTNKYIGRIDIKIAHQQFTFNDTASYFIVECKRLDGEYYLNQEYVINGISRFVSDFDTQNGCTKYSCYYKNYMLGLIIKGIDIDNNTININGIQRSTATINVLQDLIKENPKKYIYNSKYSHNGKTIELCHVFHDFSNVIEKKS